MRVAVFGGTGFVGGYLIDALIASDHEPSVLVRAGSGHKLHQAERCRSVTGDLSSMSAIEATLEACDAVIYSVGILREYPKRGITFQALQFDAVVRVAESARARGISRFLLMSANGAKSSGTRYQETKFRAEEHVRAGGLAVTIFRPSVIFGDPRGTLEIATQLYRDMIARPLPAMGFFTGWSPARGKVLMSPVHVEDVALAFVKSFDDPSAIGRTYELGGPESLAWPDMLRRIAQAAGRDKWILPMPIRLMTLAATLMDRLPYFPVTRDQLTMLSEGNTADPTELESLIGRPARAFVPPNLAYIRA
ncbi:MAG: NAD(P)H-binding protein [Woeseia sp.]